MLLRLGTQMLYQRERLAQLRCMLRELGCARRVRRVGLLYLIAGGDENKSLPVLCC